CIRPSTPTSTTPILISFRIANPPKDDLLNRTYCGSAIRLGQCYIVVRSRSSRRKFRNFDFFVSPRHRAHLYSTWISTSVVVLDALRKRIAVFSENLNVYHRKIP